MKGKLNYNLELSKRGADAVVNELVKNYGLNKKRLTPDGIRPLAPAAINGVVDKPSAQSLSTQHPKLIKQSSSSI